MKNFVLCSRFSILLNEEIPGAGWTRIGVWHIQLKGMSVRSGTHEKRFSFKNLKRI